jgi:hypothetical protein
MKVTHGDQTFKPPPWAGGPSRGKKERNRKLVLKSTSVCGVVRIGDLGAHAGAMHRAEQFSSANESVNAVVNSRQLVFVSSRTQRGIHQVYRY